MATRTYSNVSDRNFEIVGTTPGSSEYATAVISGSNPIPAYTAMTIEAAVGPATGKTRASVAQTGEKVDGILQVSCTKAGQIRRVRVRGISKARITAVAVAAGVPVDVGSTTGQVRAATIAAGKDRAAAFPILGRSHSVGAGVADELIEVDVNPHVV